ncbi:hypothetical protein V493_02937 [Pseudogymnoascus sp. VKM F-4281 (FW-2241)]|nr:hypothetical protein V493_02937 [Pseudogymnoascus sp. VKM F-4281 (FW-2241)]
MSSYLPPPPAGTPPAGIQLYNRPSRPSNDRRPDEEKLIQFELDKESLIVWVYLPPYVRKSAVYDEIVDGNDKRFLWQDAVRLRVAVLEEIRKNDQDAANQDAANVKILRKIEEVTASGLTHGIQYVKGLTLRLPFNGEAVDEYLLRLFTWETALTHRKSVKIYLGMTPYCSSTWKTVPAYEGEYCLDLKRNAHFIVNRDNWSSFETNDNDIQGRLVIIEEVKKLAEKVEEGGVF